MRQLMTYMMEDWRTIPSANPDRAVLYVHPSSVSATAARISANIFSTSVKGQDFLVTLAAISWINTSPANILKNNNHFVIDSGKWIYQN